MTSTRRSTPRTIPKMMIAFVIRRCTVDLGHTPNAAEFAAWANNQGDGHQPHCLFGRPINELEATVILKHQARLVSAKSAGPDEEYIEEDLSSPSSKVVRLDSVRERLRLLRRKTAASRDKR